MLGGRPVNGGNVQKSITPIEVGSVNNGVLRVPIATPIHGTLVERANHKVD